MEGASTSHSPPYPAKRRKQIEAEHKDDLDTTEPSKTSAPRDSLTTPACDRVSAISREQERRPAAANPKSADTRLASQDKTPSRPSTPSTSRPGAIFQSKIIPNEKPQRPRTPCFTQSELDEIWGSCISLVQLPENTPIDAVERTDEVEGATRPALSWVTIITEAFQQDSSHRLSARDIRDRIKRRYPYFTHAAPSILKSGV